ncbi:YjbF family lipoprotein [Variovorax sp. UC122_21]|uniref:YjbF family lipoprotein n=1 Tax=Variovorax sp. UC122_21 TaxID=3374554 RepID=UPI003757C43B
MLDTARALYGGQSSASSQAFNPNFAYLRADISGRTLYMVLGYLDQRPEGAVEVWYSGGGEVIRLLNGRLIGTTGLSTDWRAVRIANWPAWPTTASNAGSAPVQRYERERDVMPGYRFGINDEITRISIPAPSDSAIAGTDRSRCSGMRSAASRVRRARLFLPPDSGISNKTGTPVVIYSEQCISNNLCMSFERWTPPTPPAVGAPASAGT